MHKAKKKTISTYHKKNHTKMSNNTSKYSAEDEQTSKVSARSKSVLLYSAAFLLAELMMLFILKANHFLSVWYEVNADHGYARSECGIFGFSA